MFFFSLSESSGEMIIHGSLMISRLFSFLASIGKDSPGDLYGKRSLTGHGVRVSAVRPVRFNCRYANFYCTYMALHCPGVICPVHIRTFGHYGTVGSITAPEEEAKGR